MFGVVVAGGALVALAPAQVPDLVNALDVGGRSMGAGGSFGVTAADPASAYFNPAGLGYIDASTVGLAYRNLPRSRTRVAGQRDDPRSDTKGFRGSNALSFLGVAVPLRRGGGTVGLAYTVGGFVRDRRTGTVSDGGNQGALDSRRELKTEFFTLSYGKANRDMSAAYGVGLVFAQTDLSLRETFGSFDETSVSGSANGLGFQVGAQFVPKNSPNVSLGVSYRSEIDLQNNRRTSDLYDRIPARLAGGIAVRQDGVRGGSDFIVWGLQAQYFFAGRNSAFFDRDPQTSVGFGLEYNWVRGSDRVPVRLGWNLVSAGGRDFGSRNSLTWGIGYRPANGRVGFDLNFASPERGGYDMGISLTYRFGN